jgi:hypothetical protein
MVVVALVLLIACANIAGLLLARGISRRRKWQFAYHSVQMAARVARQLLTESCLLAVAGGVGGLLRALDCFSSR